jgi:hypothetical protein
MTTYASYSLPIGQESVGNAGTGYMEDNITVGTLATNSTGVVELRVDVSTVANMTRKDIELIIQAFRRRLNGARFGAADFGLL